LFAEPAEFAYYRETIRFNRRRPSVQCIGKTDVVSCAFCPKQIDSWKDIRNIFHIHAMHLHQMSEAFFFGAPLKAIQEWLIGINRLN
jgi:hypothetical protein